MIAERWEDPDDVGAPADLLVQAFLWVVRPHLPPDFVREGGEGEKVIAGVVEVGRGGRLLRGDRVDDPVELGSHGVAAELVEDRADQGGDPWLRPWTRPGFVGRQGLEP